MGELLVSGRVSSAKKDACVSHSFHWVSQTLQFDSATMEGPHQSPWVLPVWPGSINSLVLGDGQTHPTFNDGNPEIMGPYKRLRNWVDEFIPYYMEIMGV